MIIDLTPINYNKQDEILINEEINIEKEKLKGTEIEKLKNIFVKGRIYKDSLEEITLELKVTGTMTIPCSRTLKPTEYEFETEIEENIENTKKIQKTIDILPIIWENILMEIPIRIINPEAKDLKVKGDGWELITSDN
ncbi:MAG: DUF177 domain-containing protein [Bacilli bacterium]|nr:DUF177 domain-containing protein [Bacilli bacterium]MBR3209875.1 DUF177 domain-containing protein [Bacilli bacterium]